MNIDLKGTIKLVFPERKVNDKLSIREAVLTIDEETKYPQDISIQAINTKMSLLDGFKTGDKVIVKCNLKGYSANDKYFVQLTLWDITNKNRE